MDPFHIYSPIFAIVRWTAPSPSPWGGNAHPIELLDHLALAQPACSHTTEQRAQLASKGGGCLLAPFDIWTEIGRPCLAEPHSTGPSNRESVLCSLADPLGLMFSKGGHYVNREFIRLRHVGSDELDSSIDKTGDEATLTGSDDPVSQRPE